MSRALAFAAVAALLAGPAAQAQEIFWDGFEFGDLCAWSNPPMPVYHELEAFDQSGSNEVEGDAEAVAARCGVIEGTIGETYLDGGNDTPDTDFYQLTVSGPALLRIRLERIGETSDFLAAAEMRNSDSSFPSFGLTGCDPIDGYPTVTERQIYLPENGFEFLDPAKVSKQIPSDNTWYIDVDDGRNFDPCFLFDVPPDLVGGESHTYRLTYTIDPVVGSQLFFPYNHEAVQMPADGTLLVYRVDGATVSTIQSMETFKDRTEPGVLDTKLYLVRKSGSQLTTLAGDDDFDELHFDSLIGSQALTAIPHFVIVDNFGKFENGPVDLELTINFVQADEP